MFILIILNTIIPIFLLNLFKTVGEDSISSRLKIQVYISETGEIRNIEFEEYIKQVVYGEIPASFEIEAIKAQALATRSYTYRKILNKTHENAHLCTNPNHCQAWRMADDSEEYKKIAQAVESTKNEFIFYDNKVINAVYHASSGGFTEDAINVWGGNGESYLVSVESPGEDSIMKNYKSIVVIEHDEFLKKLKLDKSSKININILSRTEGERVKKIAINNKIFSGNEIRSIFGLKSSNFDIVIRNEEIKFLVRGYGHGVGMSQWGAQAMALNGKDYCEIIKHYYNNIEIKVLNNFT